MPDISCLISVLLFLTANVLNIIYLNAERNRDNFDWEEWSDLDTEYIEMEWGFRQDHKQLAGVAGWLNAVAWGVFCFPILHLAWMLSHQGKSTSMLWIHVAIGILALGASLTEWIARLFWVGSNLSSNYLMNKFNLDQWLRADLATQYPDDELGWLVLELNYIVASGFIWFVDAFEWLGLASIFILVYISVREWRKQDTTSFGGCWNALSLVLGFFCICEFVAEILRFEGFRAAGSTSIVFAIINRIILMPIWLLTLAFALPRAQLKQQYMDDENNTTTTTANGVTMKAPDELELVESEVTLSATTPAVVDGAGPAFTIDGTQDPNGMNNVAF